MSSLRERAAGVRGLILDVDGVLSDGRLFYNAQGESLKAYHARDGLGLALLRGESVRIAIISGRSSPTVEARATELGIEPCLLGRTDKSKALDEICAAWDCEAAELAAMGDDWVDMPMLRRVGISAAPVDADAAVRDMVEIVTSAKGGHGAVREFCEFLLRSRPSWDDICRRFTLEDKVE